MMPDDLNQIDKLCNEVHTIMIDASKNISVPDSRNARDIRKKISVFTYGVITQLTENLEVDIDQVYEKYLTMGGLNRDQAQIIVKRTRDEFSKYDFGNQCMEFGRSAVRQWKSGEKNIQSIIEALL